MDVQTMNFGASALTAVWLGLAAWSYNKEAETRALIYVLLAGLTIRAVTASDLWIHMWDEMFHAVVAKHLAQDITLPVLYKAHVLSFDPTEWRQAQIWLHKPPLTTWILALSLKIFGVNELGLRLPGVLLSTGSVYLTYLLGKELYSARVGLVGASIHALNGFLLLLQSGRRVADHVDTFFFFFVELGVYLAVLQIKRGGLWRLIPVGLATAAAILTKWATGLIVPAVWGIMALTRESFKPAFFKGLFLAALCLAPVIPWHLYSHAAWPEVAKWESEYNLLHLFQAVESHGGGLMYHLKTMPTYFGRLIYLPCLWFLWVLVKERRSMAHLGLLTWILLPYLVFSLAATKMPAFIMVAAPVMFLIQGLAFVRLWEFLPSRKWGRPVMVLLVAALGLVLVKGIYSVRPWLEYDRNPGWAQAMRALNDREFEGKPVVFLKNAGVAGMFYTDYPSYPFMPTRDQLQKLLQEGYTPVILDTGETPEYLLGNPKVIIIPSGKTPAEWGTTRTEFGKFSAPGGFGAKRQDH